MNEVRKSNKTLMGVAGIAAVVLVCTAPQMPVSANAGIAALGFLIVALWATGMAPAWRNLLWIPALFAWFMVWWVGAAVAVALLALAVADSELGGWRKVVGLR